MTGRHTLLFYILIPVFYVFMLGSRFYMYLLSVRVTAKTPQTEPNARSPKGLN